MLLVETPARTRLRVATGVMTKEAKETTMCSIGGEGIGG